LLPPVQTIGGGPEQVISYDSPVVGLKLSNVLPGDE